MTIILLLRTGTKSNNLYSESNRIESHHGVVYEATGGFEGS